MADADGKMRITKKNGRKREIKGGMRMEKPLNEERKTNTKYKNNLWLSSASQKRNCISRSRVHFSGFFTQTHKLRSQLRGSFFL